MEVIIQDYVDLIQQFLGKQIAPLDFREEYDKLFYREQEDRSEKVFHIRDKLFADVECYDPECLPGQESAFVVSEQELRACAAEALEKFKAVVEAS